LTPPVGAPSDVAAPEGRAQGSVRPDGAGLRHEGAGALIEEAVRRRRLSKAGFLLLVIGVAGIIGTGIGVAVSHGTAPPGARRRQTGPPGRTSTATATKASVAGAALEHPDGLAVAPNGTLYIVDTARDQVLSRLPTGTFAVVAGNGHWGFSGDGGPATEAELSLSDASGLAVSPGGTLFIADSGNDRVREVQPDGDIETVAGNGDSGMVLTATPALQAALGEVSGLAIGPDGDLYIAASDVVRFTPGGTIEWVAGNRIPPACGGIECNPASEWDFTEPSQLAFDGLGDLYVSDNNGFDLYEMAGDGQLSYLGRFRGDGAPGALAGAPDGTVVEAWRDGLTRLLANGQSSGMAGDLNGVLGAGNVFIAGDGVAVGPDGSVYLDTNTGNTFTSVSALVEVSSGGTVTPLWRS
jgi:hypothetical protein